MKTKMTAMVLAISICMTVLAACSGMTTKAISKDAFTTAAKNQKLTVNDSIQLVGYENLKATVSAENEDDSFVALYVQAANPTDALTVYNNQVTTCLSCTGLSEPSLVIGTDSNKSSKMSSDKGYAYVSLNNDTVVVVLTKTEYKDAAAAMLKELNCKHY